MLTLFYFDQEVFEDSSLRMPLANSSILDTWLNYGCLAICQEHKINIKEAVHDIPPKYLQKWVAALTSPIYKKTKVSINKPILSSLKNISEFRDEYYPHKITTGIIVSEYEALFEEKNIIIDNTNLEIVTPENINESLNFKNSILVSQLDIKKDEVYSDVWNKRFLTLAEQTSTITIIDRYMALNIINDINKGLKTSLEKFIESLSACDKNYSINVYSACDFANDNLNSSELSNYINNTLKKRPYFKKSNFEIKFALCKDHKFRDEAHDRMISFDNHVVQIGKGMDIFRDKKIDNNSFTIKSRSLSGFNDIYKELTRNREWNYKPQT